MGVGRKGHNQGVGGAECPLGAQWEACPLPSQLQETPAFQGSSLSPPLSQQCSIFQYVSDRPCASSSLKDPVFYRMPSEHP